MRHIQTLAVSVGREEHTVVPAGIHGLREGGLQVHGSGTPYELAASEIFKPVLRTFDRIKGYLPRTGVHRNHG